MEEEEDDPWGNGPGENTDTDYDGQYTPIEEEGDQ